MTMTVQVHTRVRQRRVRVPLHLVSKRTDGFRHDQPVSLSEALRRGRRYSAAVDSLPLGLLHLGTLYDFDSRGRILAIREPDAPPPPRLHLLRTPEGALALVRHDLPDDLAGQILALARSEPWPEEGEVDAPPLHDEKYRRLLASLGPVERDYHGPALVLLGPFPEDPRPTRIDETNVSLLAKHFGDDGAHLDLRSPIWAMVDRKDAIAICMSSRNPGLAVPAGVFTVEAYRRLGFATLVTSAWAEEVTASGRLPFYGTTWENEASQQIAGALGGAMFGSDYWLR